MNAVMNHKSPTAPRSTPWIAGGFARSSIGTPITAGAGPGHQPTHWPGYSAS